MPDYIICIKPAPANEGQRDRQPTERLVRAKNEARAIAYVVKDTIGIDRATTDDVIRVTGDGVKLEIVE